MRAGVHRQGPGQAGPRPELDRALLVARTGDQLVAAKLDRLGRSLEHPIDLSKDLQARNVDLVVLDQGRCASVNHYRAVC
ncbi:MAG TPA: recombinase family protein [Streptosporangiaceae bacterium]|nr:recombinase family protein [Streptosporangiaceae bacterium]